MDELSVEKAAHKAVQDFVNAQGCKSREDVQRCLEKLAAMTVAAIQVVSNGKMEKLQ